MIDISLSGWWGFAALIVMAQATGLSLGRCIRWSEPAARAGLPSAFGHALGPFIAGLGSVLVLWLMPGASHVTHLVAMAAGFLILIGLGWRYGLAQPAFAPSRREVGEWVLRLLLASWLVLMLVNVVFLPLTQNDPLEYAIVGRLLFASGDLASYPAIYPSQGASGFFGPWTHPPLYVGLIYLMNAVQGSAETPGLMRLISPWFAIAATSLLFRIGCLYSRRFGLLAAVVFISTPMFFAGADSAQIDPLPVLGIMLVIAAILGLEKRSPRRAITIGLTLGVALWPHSQAVLFIPLAIVAMVVQCGIRQWRELLRDVACVLIAAILIGAWPYIRNILIFGSPISDNPTIFAMPELAWSEYLRLARGLDNWLAVLQYGIFKGWFALTAFGWTFWLMAAGAFLLLVQRGLRGLTALVRDGTRSMPLGLAALWISMAVILTYLAGVVASVALGLDLMIKNERYTLILLPMTSLCAAYAVESLIRGAIALASSPQAPAWRKDRVLLATNVIFCMLAFQLAYVGWYYKWRLVPSFSIEEETDEEVAPQVKRFDRLLDSNPNLRAVRWMSREISHDALVLSFRPADMYYARQRMVSYLDPSLVALYREKDPGRALQLLKGLGITHVHLPNYSSPVTYNTVLGQLLASPQYAELLQDANGTQIYKLGDSKRVVIKGTDISPGKFPWTQWIQPLLPGVNTVLRGLGYRGHPVRDNAPFAQTSEWPLAHRDFSTITATGAGISTTAFKGQKLPVIAGREYRVTMHLEGQAFVRIWLAQFDQLGRLLAGNAEGSASRIEETIVTTDSGLRTLSRRFIAPQDTAFVRISVEQVGYSTLRIEQALLEEVALR